MSLRLMLDTNTVGEIISYRRPEFRARLRERARGNALVSAISYAETMYGLAKKPQATRLQAMAAAFLAEAEIVDFTRSAAERYGTLRDEMRRAGRSLQPLDMLIAAHALEAGATLVSSDHAFRHVPGLSVEDWTEV